MQSPLITVMSNAAIKGGKGLLRDFGEVDNLQISRKGPANFVTKSDIRTEKLLQKELQLARPNFGFLLEEGGEVKGKDEHHRWIIDPLDGTSNFIHAIPYFCISIGLERRDANTSEIIAGVIFDPIHNELFWAEKGKGAFMNNRKLAVTERPELEDSMLVTSNNRATPDAQRQRTYSQFDQLTQGGATVRHFGATALDLAYVAAGRFDGCWYHTIQPWDIAAGIVLVQEAGGLLTDLEGKPAHALSPTLLATSRQLSAPLQKMLAKAA